MLREQLVHLDKITETEKHAQDVVRDLCALFTVLLQDPCERAHERLMLDEMFQVSDPSA